MDTVGQSNHRKGHPNYPAEFKHRLTTAACEPGASVSKLAQQPSINANMLFKWRRDLHASLLTEAKSQSAHLLPAVMQHTPVRAALRRVPVPVRVASVEIVIADAVVRVNAGTDAALLQLVLHSLRT